MANIKPGEQDSLPKSGRVTEVCKEWSVREDGALAYRLQNEEITGHLQSNKYRNAVVRQDFPCAVDEQLREQQLAEQAAAVYHQMLAEQEEIDNLYAKQLADKIEHEERLKRRAAEAKDEQIVGHLVENELVSVPSGSSHYNSPQKVGNTSFYNTNSNQMPFRQEKHSSRRQALAMPLPDDANIVHASSPKTSFIDNNIVQDHYVYTEPYRTNNDLANQLDRIDIAELGVPLEEISQRTIQEQRDALLARKLQQQEDSSKESQLNRDRLLAIEAQDKELAKLLQERERQKAKRSKERAKQKALAKKQLQSKEQDIHQILPDDSYSNPADLLPSPHNIDSTHSLLKQTHHRPDITNHTEEDLNYSFPVDVLPSKMNCSLKQSYDSKFNQDNIKILNAQCSTLPENDIRTPVRPTQLDLKYSNYPSKPKYSDSEFVDNSAQHVNIAMAIDPTYTRRNHHGTTYYDTSSSTVTTSTSSSSPGLALPPFDISEHENETSPVPPYMPIQGQRRTASLEKKSKKKSKDACKQQ